MSEKREILKRAIDTFGYPSQMHMVIEEMSELTKEMNLAVEHNRQVANEEQLKKELSYRDGMIAGLKYAIRCNGVSGGEVS